MKNIRLLILLFFLSVATCVSAQTVITVKSFNELMSDLSARTNRRYDMNDKACALIKVLYPREGATFEGNIVGDPDFRQGEYWVYISEGTKRIRVHLPDTPTITVEFSSYKINQVESETTYVLEFHFPEQTSAKLPVSFYIEGGFSALAMMGPTLSLGTYLGAFNLEVNAHLPMAPAETVYWNSPSHSSVMAEYKQAYTVGARAGFGIRMGKVARLTPQAGVLFMKTSESIDEDNPPVSVSGAYCSSLIAALKLQFMMGKHFAFGLTPAYMLPIVKSEGYKTLSSSPTGISKWNSGLCGNLSLCVSF